MRSGFYVVIIVTLLFAGGYFYNLAQAVCPIPVEYRIGIVDERFNFTEDEAKVAVAEAAETWEKATGQNLFSYDEAADFTINFVFDERQELVEAGESFEKRLNVVENINEAFTETYETLVGDYERLKVDYETKVSKYEQRLAEYNDTVQKYNEAGGAPTDAFADLEAEKDWLNQERQSLSDLQTQLNTVVDEINSLGARGNELVETYNEDVSEFNEQFGEAREFTQGEYTTDTINIYSFKDKQELHTVLAHELGHALSLDHVSGTSSIMFYLIGGQPQNLKLSETDVEEFKRVCGDMNLWDKIKYQISK